MGRYFTPGWQQRHNQTIRILQVLFSMFVYRTVYVNIEIE
jgi:hypothetical protein